jgi:hypothetical protein
MPRPATGLEVDPSTVCLLSIDMAESPSSVTAVLVAGEATERHVDPPPCLARAW